MLRRKSRLDDHGYSHKLALHTANMNRTSRKKALIENACSGLRVTLKLCMYIGLPVVEESKHSTSQILTHMPCLGASTPRPTDHWNSLVFDGHINPLCLDPERPSDHALVLALTYKGFETAN
jgi:hypothetical protein